MVQRKTKDPRITGDMAIYKKTLNFVQERKAAGYSDIEAQKAKFKSAAEELKKTPIAK